VPAALEKQLRRRYHINGGKKDNNMEKIREFFAKAESHRKSFVIVIAVIGILLVVSLARLGFWATRRSRTSSPRAYMGKLESKNKEEKKYAIYTLGQTGVKSAIPEIEKIINGNDEEDVKRVAAWSLGTLDREKLAALLGSTRKDVKLIAMETLMKMEKTNLHYLVDRFGEEDKETKHLILGYIDRYGPGTLQEKLMDIAEEESEDAGIRKRCLEMLRSRDIGEMENRLYNLYYNDPDEEIKKTAYDTIQAGKDKS
jgi:hypothetical protein